MSFEKDPPPQKKSKGRKGLQLLDARECSEFELQQVYNSTTSNLPFVPRRSLLIPRYRDVFVREEWEGGRDHRDSNVCLDS